MFEPVWYNACDRADYLSLNFRQFILWRLISLQKSLTLSSECLKCLSKPSVSLNSFLLSNMSRSSAKLFGRTFTVCFCTLRFAKPSILDENVRRLPKIWFMVSIAKFYNFSASMSLICYLSFAPDPNKGYEHVQLVVSIY